MVSEYQFRHTLPDISLRAEKLSAEAAGEIAKDQAAKIGMGNKTALEVLVALQVDIGGVDGSKVKAIFVKDSDGKGWCVLVKKR